MALRSGELPALDPRGDIDSVVDEVSRLLRLRIGAAVGDLPAITRIPDVLDLLCGGKHIRTRVLVVTALTFGEPEPAFLRRAGVALELLHTASLVHDDIIDGSPSRRGHPALHLAADEPTAILVGDLLVALAFDEVAPLGTAATAALARAFTALCTGQLLESSLGWGDDAQAAIERYAGLKTGALFAAALELAALADGLTAERGLLFRQAGQQLGVAFQLADDLLDLHGDVAEMGKQAGADLRNGVPTLPIWVAYRRLVDAGAIEADAGAFLDRLTEEAVSEEPREFTRQRVTELVGTVRGLLPAPRRPELLAAMLQAVLPGHTPAHHETEGGER